MTLLLFGFNISTSAAPGPDPVADARTAEERHHPGRRRDGHPHHGENQIRKDWRASTSRAMPRNEDLTEEGVPVSQELLGAAR